MGILSKIIGRREDPRVGIVREVAKRSIKGAMANEALTQYSQEDISLIDRMGPLEVMSLPDATVLTIFEQFITLAESGVSEHDALVRIEKVRNQAVVGQRQFPLSFIEYIHYRVNVEHGSGSNDRLHTTIKIIKDLLLPSSR